MISNTAMPASFFADFCCCPVHVLVIYRCPMHVCVPGCVCVTPLRPCPPGGLYIPHDVHSFPTLCISVQRRWKLRANAEHVNKQSVAQRLTYELFAPPGCIPNFLLTGRARLG